MNPQVPNELISAYFDGEVTPEERAAVERLLGESDDAQRELNETARLSALLHSFPRESAPVELASNVLRQTSQMALPAQPQASPAKPNVWRERKAILIAVLTTAACMLIALGVVDYFGANPANHVALEEHRAAPMAGLPASTPAVAMKESADMPSREMYPGDDLPRPSAAKQSMPAPAAMIAADAVPAPISPKEGIRTPSKSAIAESGLEMAQKPGLQTVLTNEPQVVEVSQLGLTNEEFVRGLKDNKIYTLAPSPADPNTNVAVVQFEVVDIDRSSEFIQVLLKRNSINRLSVNNDPERTPNDWVLVYAYAPGDQLARTIVDVEKHPDLFKRWTAQLPLQLAANEQAKDAVPKTESLKGDTKAQAGSQPVNESLEEEPEAQRVSRAYFDRTGLQNSIAMNTTNPLSRSRENRSDNSRGTQQITRGQEKKSGEPELRNSIGNSIGYDVIRLNGGNTLTNNGLSSNQAYSPLQQENSQRRMGANTVQNPALANRQSPGEKATGDPTNPMLRVLFVLHPQENAEAASNANPAPNAAAPAKPER